MADDAPQGALLGETVSANHRSGFVALVGKPNVGKSTLLNAWMGMKLAAVSPRPQTTRNRLLGIYTLPEAQVIFVDTPGIHLPHTRLQEYMVTAARRSVPDADLVLMMVDVTAPPSEADRAVAELVLAQRRLPVILALNKVDLLDSEQLAARRAQYEALGSFAVVAPISALTGVGCPELLQEIIAHLPLGPRFYPADQVTDQQERFIAGELIREQAMRLLSQELPHAVAVMVDEFKERENGVTYIAATLYVEKDSQKGIIIGRNGTMLKRIGAAARGELEQLLETRVFIELWVKVHHNWRRDEQFLRLLGYSPSGQTG